MSTISRARRLVYLVIRYDDYGAAYGDDCPARFEVEEMLQREMAARCWPWLCAITPRQSVDPHDVDEQRTVSLGEDQPRVRLLRKAVTEGLCEPAVHGLTHHTWKRLPRWGTEFTGLPTGKQYEILRTARGEVEELVDRRVSVFVPPWNSFDENTVRAATQAGFKILSAGLRAAVAAQPPLHMVPATVELIHLRQILDRRHRFPGGSVVVVLMHATDFVSVDSQIGYLHLEEFGPLLDRAVDELGAEVAPISRIPQLLNGDLYIRTDRAIRLYRRHERLSNLPLLGHGLRRWMLPHVSALIPTAVSKRVGWIVAVVTALWFVGVAFLGCLPAFAIARLVSTEPARTIGLLTVGLCGVVLGAHSGRNAFLKRYRRHWGTRRIGLRTWTALTAAFALVLSMILQWVVSLNVA